MNTKTGFSMNISIDINEELDNIAVIFPKFDQKICSILAVKSLSFP
jgi:hypothetical protein